MWEEADPVCLIVTPVRMSLKLSSCWMEMVVGEKRGSVFSPLFPSLVLGKEWNRWVWLVVRARDSEHSHYCL